MTIFIVYNNELISDNEHDSKNTPGILPHQFIRTIHIIIYLVP